MKDIVIQYWCVVLGINYAINKKLSKEKKKKVILIIYATKFVDHLNLTKYLITDY